MTFLVVVFNSLSHVIKCVFLVLIKFYKLCISPILPNTCRFYPTCSTYMIFAIKEWGIIKGCWLGCKRIFKCRPKGPCGEDFVPINVKGDLKWIF